MQASVRPHVVIIGGGFAGLRCAKALAGAPVDVTLIDKRNHHLFQPLLYQVATAGLSPSQIAAPIRGVLRAQKNCRVLMGEVIDIDRSRKTITHTQPDGTASTIAYDYLVLASGATHSYFGHEAWAPFAPGLKTLDDALLVRRKFLTAFESAEQEQDDSRRDAWMTFVIIGAGPTGVEMAGAMMEIALKTIPSEFRRIDTRRAKVILIEAQGRVLPGGFPPELSTRAERDLRDMGVDVRLNTRVIDVHAAGVTLAIAAGETTIQTNNVLWAAGVKASELGSMLGADTDIAGRVRVGKDLSIPGDDRVFVAGDLAHVIDARTGQAVPGMAPGAMQMGTFVGRLIAREVRAGASLIRPDFRFVDKGVMATIGRSRAVAMVFGGRYEGTIAWLMWAGLHILFLISFRTKLLVLIDWVWSYVTFGRGARLITGDSET